LTRPAEEPGTPLRQMATHDRIRLTGLLPRSPAPVGLRHERADRRLRFV